MSTLHLRGPVLVGVHDQRDEAWVVDGRLTFTPPTGPAARDVTTLDGWVLPGLVDAHCHIGLGPDGPVDHATTHEQMVTEREAGALLLRDAGSPLDTHWTDEEPDLPRLVRAGQHIARTKRYLRNYGVEIEPDTLADEAARQAGRGDGWVKLVGDWLDREAAALTPCWPDDEVAAAIAAAQAAGARVTAHCFGEDSVRQLVTAGIDCIEHGTGLTADLIPLLAERQVPVVPTLVNTGTLDQIAHQAETKFPAYADHLRRLHADRYATVRAAHEAGIPLYTGTDAGGGLPHGLIATEVTELVTAGLTTREALQAACWDAREWLGSPPLTEGSEADLLIVPDDPREHVGVLRSPSAIVLRGRHIH
jgi:imidazolonepropionase-like amidohydrolase